MSQPILTVKNLKVAEFASEETLCFEATIYVDGKPFCRASNEGRGGPNNYWTLEPNPGRDVTIHAELAMRLSPRAKATNAEARLANEAEGLTREKLGWDGWLKADDAGLFYRDYYGVFERAVGKAVHRARVAKDLKRMLGSRVLYTAQDQDGLFETRRGTKDELAGWLAHPELADKLNAKEILNRMPFEEALDLFLAKAKK